MTDVGCLLCRERACVRLQESEAPYAVYHCSSCDHAFVSPLPNEQMLQLAYNNEAYYAEWITTQAARRARLWRSRAARVLGGRPAGQLFDVGCGEGSFLAEAKTRGWWIAGMEISEAGCRIAEARLGIRLSRGALEAASWPAASFDVVTLWHVIEHVPDPFGLMQEVARIVRPGGTVVVACPNRRSYLYNVAYRIGRDRPLRLFHPSDRELHLSHFSVRSLRFLLAKVGLSVTRVDVDRGHVQRIQAAIDLVAVALYRCTGLLWSQAMEVWAIKSPQRSAPASY